MRNVAILVLAGLLATSAWAQGKQIRTERRPAAAADPASIGAAQKQPTYQYFSILDGTPIHLSLHHDTEAGTGTPIDVYDFVIELQVLNSDGNLEPVGLQIHNFYTAHAVNPNSASNPYNARDCKIWNGLILNEIALHSPTSLTWPYVEFVVAQGARTLQTNEDGQVFWSDDIECWGSRDRFPPF